MVTACVEALGAAPSSAKLVLRYFEIWLLRLAGSFPDTTRCAVCGSQPAAGEALYLNVEGTARCGSCSRGLGTVLAPAVQQLLSSSQRLGPAQFATEHQNNFGRIEPDVAALTHRLILRALERRPRAMITPATVAQP